MSIGEWMLEGNCSGSNSTSIFFPESTDPRVIAVNKERAARICSGCPVREECLRFAVANRERGFWAGSDEHERSLIALLRPDFAGTQPTTTTESFDGDMDFMFLST